MTNHLFGTGTALAVDWYTDSYVALARDVAATENRGPIPSTPAEWLRDPALVPLTDAVASRVPDAFTARNHETVAKRTTDGRSTFEVKRYGRATVTGEMRWQPWHTASDQRVALGILLSEIGHSEHLDCTGRMDALFLSRCADAILGECALPSLLGTDVTSWEQVVHDDDSATDHGVAWHNYPDQYAAARAQGFGPVLDALEALPVRYACRSYRAFRGTRGETRKMHADTGADLRDVAAFDNVRARPLAKRQARVRVSLGRGKRASDPVDVHTFRDHGPAAWSVFGVTECVAPANDTEHRFIGHRLVKRPALKARHGARTERRARVRRAAVITFGDASALARHAATMQPGDRVRWQIGDVTGTVSRGPAGPWSVRVKVSDVTRSRGGLRSARYVGNVVRNATRVH